MAVHHGANVRRDAREEFVIPSDVDDEPGDLEDDEESKEGGRLALRGERGRKLQ